MCALLSGKSYWLKPEKGLVIDIQKQVSYSFYIF